jgi:hypothetical protein
LVARNGPQLVVDQGHQLRFSSYIPLFYLLQQSGYAGWIAVLVCLIHVAIPSQSQGPSDVMEFTRLGFQVARSNPAGLDPGRERIIADVGTPRRLFPL